MGRLNHLSEMPFPELSSRSRSARPRGRCTQPAPPTPADVVLGDARRLGCDSAIL